MHDRLARARRQASFPKQMRPLRLGLARRVVVATSALKAQVLLCTRAANAPRIARYNIAQPRLPSLCRHLTSHRCPCLLALAGCRVSVRLVLHDLAAGCHDAEFASCEEPPHKDNAIGMGCTVPSPATKSAVSAVAMFVAIAVRFFQ